MHVFENSMWWVLYKNFWELNREAAEEQFYSCFNVKTFKSLRTLFFPFWTNHWGGSEMWLFIRRLWLVTCIYCAYNYATCCGSDDSIASVWLKSHFQVLGGSSVFCYVFLFIEFWVSVFCCKVCCRSLQRLLMRTIFACYLLYFLRKFYL